MATGQRGHVVRRSQHFHMGLWRRAGECTAAQYRQVGPVVADRGSLVPAQAQRIEDGLRGRLLVFGPEAGMRR